MHQPDVNRGHDDDRRPLAEPPDRDAAQTSSPAADGGPRARTATRMAVGPIVAWWILLTVLALLAFVGFCALPGLKSSVEDDGRRPSQGSGLGDPPQRR